jgi:hypothetical protein
MLKLKIATLAAALVVFAPVAATLLYQSALIVA